MKLTLERDALQGALGRVGKSVGRGANIPIVGNVLLRACTEGLSVVATDLDIIASSRIPASVTEPGELTVPAKMLQDIVARSPSGSQMALDAAGDGPMVLRVGRSRIALQALPAADFPDMPIETTTHEFVVDVKDLARLFGRVAYAISSEETRYYLCGVFLHMIDGKLRAVATDGHRLARNDMPAPLGAEGMPPVIIPTKTVAEIVRLGKGADCVAKVAFAKGMMVVDIEETRIVSKLVDGTFPDYLRVIPTTNDKHVTFDVEAFGNAAARLAAIAGETSLLLSLSPDLLQISVNNPVAGEATDEIEADYSSEALAIRFAANYLRATIDALDCPRAVARFDNPGGPAIFEPYGDPSLLLILMPRRT